MGLHPIAFTTHDLPGRKRVPARGAGCSFEAEGCPQPFFLVIAVLRTLTASGRLVVPGETVEQGQASGCYDEGEHNVALLFYFFVRADFDSKACCHAHG